MTAPVEGPSGQTLTPIDKSKLPKREATAEEKQMLDEMERKIEQRDEIAAKVTKEHLSQQLQTVFRLGGSFFGYVSEDAVTRIDGNRSVAQGPELDQIRSNLGISSQQRAEQLSQRISEKLEAEYGSSVEIEHYAPGEGPTVADIRAEISDNFNSASELLEAKREKLGLSPGAFAEAFGEK